MLCVHFFSSMELHHFERINNSKQKKKSFFQWKKSWILLKEEKIKARPHQEEVDFSISKENVILFSISYPFIFCLGPSTSSSHKFAAIQFHFFRLNWNEVTRIFRIMRVNTFSPLLRATLLVHPFQWQWHLWTVSFIELSHELPKAKTWSDNLSNQKAEFRSINVFQAVENDWKSDEKSVIIINTSKHIHCVHTNAQNSFKLFVLWFRLLMQTMPNDWYPIHWIASLNNKHIQE